MKNAENKCRKRRMGRGQLLCRSRMTEKEEGCMKFSNQMTQGGVDQLSNHQT